MNAKAGTVRSVNTGTVRERIHDGRRVHTGIFKQPVAGAVRLRFLGFEGDAQADRTHHGGPHQAAYAYPYEHYEHWSAWLGGRALPCGTFGENLTTEGLLETGVSVGDVFQVGEAVVQVSAHRTPCSKLGMAVGHPGIVAEFLSSRRLGFYLRVRSEGCVRAGDPWILLEREPAGVTVVEFAGLFAAPAADPALLARALAIPSLPEETRRRLERRATS